MLKKLRIKFVAVVMASVAIVLAVVFTGICASEYQRTMSSIDVAMSNAIDRAAMGGMDGFDRGAGWSDGSADGGRPAGKPGPRDEFLNEREGQFQGPRIGGEGLEMREIVPVAVYEVAQTVEVSELQIVSGFTTAEIDENVLSEASSRVIAVGDGQGTFSDLGLHYQKRTTETTTYVAFADTTSTMGWQSLAMNLVVAAIVVLAVFFALSLVLSKWALRPVEEAWTAQRQFVADASHELKTPLTVVLANTSILLKHPEASVASQSQWVESTQVEAEHMQGLVNEMLELAQVESRSGLQREEFDYSDLVDGLVLQFESVAFERGCELEGQVAEGLKVNGDIQRLRKMTSTLIENALKYVEEGGRVSVVLTRSGKMASLAINNTGSTIAPEDLPHIFDRFYRTDKARTSGAGGYGLGLAIAREIAREHDGDITCASSPSKGTTFTATIPCVQ